MRRFGKDQGGQAILIMAMGMVLLVGIAGLAIDSSNLYLNRRQAQNAADFAAFAAGKQLAAAAFTLTAPPSSGDPSVRAAHDFAALNGFNTVYSTSCDTSTPGSFSATWFDSGGFACNAGTGFRTKIQVNVPAVAVGGLPTPSSCTGQSQFSCFQVTITEKVDTIFGRTFGVSNFYYSVSAVVKTTPAIQGYTLPPPVAAYLYQPQTGCLPLVQQCFVETVAPSRTNLTCTGNNCPTFWVNNGTKPIFWGTDGAKSIPIAGDIVTLESNGDMVIQDQTIICDPYNGAICSNGNAIGNKGFALAPGSTLYCNSFSNGGTANGLIPCTNTTPPGALDKMTGKETVFVTLASWSPTVDTSGLDDCGALVLNGNTVQSSFTIAGAASCYDVDEPYVVQPGRYQYIVVNHGTYEFESGLYDLTSVAPVNTATSGFSNGIDHKNEQAGVTKDFDLCTGGQVTSCPTLTASIWIGHGALSHGPFVGPTSGTCVGGNLGSSGGGGDATVVSGSGVAFRFELGAGGFVSTHEVEGVAFSAPGIGALPEVSGAPLLFDLENSSFIHLDAQEIKNSISQFSGLIWQNPTATAGGVEVNPGLAANNVPAISGQLFAYSLTTFGIAGPVIDFTDDYGGVSQPLIATSGKAETSLVTSTTLAQAVDGSGNPISGYQTLTIHYTDEWALDAYNLYLKLNNAQPVFFSQGIWSPTPPFGASLPPGTNNPGDANPAYPAGSPPSPYTGTSNGSTHSYDWTYVIGSGATASTWEVAGNWTWGHESDINNATTRTNLATIKYTFPVPAGQSLAVTIFLTDGDHCGDYYLVQVTLNNVGQPNGGSQSAGSVVLVR